MRRFPNGINCPRSVSVMDQNKCREYNTFYHIVIILISYFIFVLVDDFFIKARFKNLSRRRNVEKVYESLFDLCFCTIHCQSVGIIIVAISIKFWLRPVKLLSLHFQLCLLHTSFVCISTTRYNISISFELELGNLCGSKMTVTIYIATLVVEF